MKIIDQCESLGHFLALVDGKLNVGSIDDMPPDLLQELSEKKQLVIEALNRDRRMKRIGATIGVPGEAYIWSLSPYSCLLLERINNEWKLYRANYYRGQDPRYKTIATGISFDYVAGEAGRYVSYLLNRDKK